MKNLQAVILLFFANSISGMAQGISMIAIPWYFTQSAETSMFAWIYALITAASLVWGPLSGTFVDKYNRKHIFLVLTVISGSLLFGIASLGYYWGALPWYLVALVFLMTFLNYNVHYPNLYAFVQEITEPKYYHKITSFIEIQGQMTTVLAGAGAALLLEGTTDGYLVLFGVKVAIPYNIAAWQLHEIFLLDASTYLVAFFLIIMIRFKPFMERKVENGTIIEQLKVGLEYLMNNKNIFIFGIASYSIFVTVLISNFYLLAIYVKNHLHESGQVYASSEMYYAVGAIFAGLAIQFIFKHMTTIKAIIIMTLAAAGLFIVMAINPNVAIFYAMSLLLGITNAGTRILRVTYLFKNVPNQVYGRAGSIFFLSNILFRISFLMVFSLPFFHIGNNIIYACGLFSIFLVLSAGVLLYYYRPMTQNLGK